MGKGERANNRTEHSGQTRGSNDTRGEGKGRRGESRAKREQSRTERRQVRGEKREKVRRRSYRRAPRDDLRERTEKVAKVVSHVNEMAEQQTDSTVRSGQDWPRASCVPRCAAFSTCPWHAHGKLNGQVHVPPLVSGM